MKRYRVEIELPDDFKPCTINPLAVLVRGNAHSHTMTIIMKNVFVMNGNMKAIVNGVQ